jgi:uncharacterized membrane protein
MKRIIFTNPAAQKIYDDYIKRVTRCIGLLSADDQRDTLMEINSHIYEATNAAAPENEIEILLDTLEKLGSPEEVLQPLVAYKKAQQATRSFNPVHILQAMRLNIANGAAYVILAFFYLLSVSFCILIILKIIYPSHTGLFMQNDKFIAFGFTTELHAGLTEVLGQLFIPVVILLMGALYFLNTLLFRLLKKE